MIFSLQQEELCESLGVAFADIDSNGLFDSAQIKRWLNMAKDKALSYRKWPFLEATGTDLIESGGSYPYPTLAKTKSVWLITVDGERFVKISYEDYLKYLEEFSSGDNKVWSEYDRTIHINGNAVIVGNAVIMYGQIGVVDMSTGTDKTPFDEAEPSGDEAVIKFARAIALGSEKLKNPVKATKENSEAKDILDDIWNRLMENKPREVRKSRPRLKRINILTGTTRDSNRDNIGRF